MDIIEECALGSVRRSCIHTGLSLRSPSFSGVVFRPQCPVRSQKTIVLSRLSSWLMWSSLGLYPVSVLPDCLELVLEEGLGFHRKLRHRVLDQLFLFN